MQVHLRSFAFAAGLILSGTSQAQEALRVADLLCDARKLSPRDYTECLRKAQEDSDRLMRDRISAITATIEQTPGLAKPQILRWKKALDDSQTLWVRFRNGECQEMTPFETTNKNRMAEEQRVCILDHNQRRMGALQQRYPGAGA
jgi:uncharacterized protein YecT (DUF1311 family)